MARIERPAIDIDPAQWSRRKPVGRFDRDAVLHLICPAQTATGWRYLDALAVLADPQLALAARERKLCRVPDRRTVLQSEATRQVLEETHDLGAWVVNFDDLLDRRQLLNSGISVIRYKHGADGNRSLIISSKASDTLLRATLCSRLRSIDAGYDGEAASALAARMIGEANAVSGDIVLRAARRGTSAGELIGVVLSKFLVDKELGDRPKVWFFLDDYAGWLGQPEGRVADLLCLAPIITPEGERLLDVIVTEAKFVSASKVSDKADLSQVQLRSSLRRFERALSESGQPADAVIWRARLAEMLQDALRDDEAIDASWRTDIRAGRCTIRVAGYSHVFTHGVGDTETGQGDHMTGVEGTLTGYQERFKPSTVREIVRLFSEDRDPTPLRRELGATPLGEVQVADSAQPTPTGPAASAESEPEPASEPAPEPGKVLRFGGPEHSPQPLAGERGNAAATAPTAALGFWDLLRSWAQERTAQETDTLWLDRIIFTSGATEANSWAVFGSLTSPSQLVSCALEHSSLLAALRMAAARGHQVDLVRAGASGLIDRDDLKSVLRPTTRLVSIQFANNETGAVQPLGDVAAIVREFAPDALIHTDATQAIGREAVDLSAELADVDLLSFSAHKFHGPKGIGGLFVREGVHIEPLIPGEQAEGLRGGTLNTPAAAGLEMAALRARARLPEMVRVARLRDQLERRLLALHPGAYVHARDVCRLPNTASIAFPGIDAEHIVEQLAWRGICVATGSACTAGAATPSHVLTAMGVKADDARATIRFSLSADTTELEIDRAAEALTILLRTPTMPTEVGVLLDP